VELSLKEMFLIAETKNPARSGIQFAGAHAARMFQVSMSAEPFQWMLNCLLHFSTQFRRFPSIVVEIMLSIAKAFTMFSQASFLMNGSIHLVECEVMNPLNDNFPLNHVVSFTHRAKH
jgi:hypothetical protein